MATLQQNIIMKGARGMFGDTVVFKTLRGKTIIANRPRPPKKQSAQQRENRSRFREATYYAKAVMLDPEKKAYYWQKAKELNLPNAYTAAVTDYMRKPKIEAIDTSAYTGKTSETITVRAKKEKFEIVEVEIIIIEEGNEIERGKGVKDIYGDWVYTTIASVADVSKVSIRAIARDGTRNRVEAVKALADVSQGK